MECLFCRIAAGAVPSSIRYEDDEIVAFDDIHPKAPTHILIIPRRHVASTLNDLDVTETQLAGKLLLTAKRLASDLRIADRGYRVVVNCGLEGGQEVPHLHVHLIGGKKLGGMA